jgi:DNA polymerase epsilon subunit 1
VSPLQLAAAPRRGHSGSPGFCGNTSFRGCGRGRDRGRGGAPAPAPLRDEDETALEERFECARVDDDVDEKMGFPRIAEGPPREGWFVNMHPVRPSRPIADARR